jgi:CubicO group peptidase (beta-lactamase class C family)
MGGLPEEEAYGYHWWVTRDASHPAYFAAGYGGQYLWVVPDLDLIVAMASNAMLPPDMTQEHRPVITDFVVPSVLTNQR